MNIFKRIEYICKKYEIDTEKYMRDQVESLLIVALNNAIKTYGKRVIVRGVPRGKDGKSYPFLELISEFADIIAVQDKNIMENRLVLHNGKTIPVIPIEQEVSGCDIYLIRSMRDGQKIVAENQYLKEKGIYIFDIYHTLATKYGTRVNAYEEYNQEIDYTCNRIKNAEIIYYREKTQDNLKNLIGQCLCLGDFVSLIRYQDEEKELILHSTEIQQFINDINGLLRDIKELINQRKTNILDGKKDIIWHWIDDVGYEELDLLPKISRKINEGIQFTNAYTTTPYTNPTIKMVFWNEYRKGKAYGDKKEFNSSGIYKLLKNNGYQFKSYGHITNLLNIGNSFGERMDISAIITISYLKMLQDILDADKPCVMLVHTFIETHPPFSSPIYDMQLEHNFFWHSYQELLPKIRNSTKYADEIIEFYTDLLGKETVNIFMSDHGKWQFCETRRWKEESTHIFLGVTNMGIQATVTRLFSLYDFDKLISFILNSFEYWREEVLIEDEPVYSEVLRQNISNRAKDDFEDICSGYTGIVTEMDKYILQENGKEYYFIKSEGESINRLNEITFKERIEYLKRKVCDHIESQRRQ